MILCKQGTKLLYGTHSVISQFFCALKGSLICIDTVLRWFENMLKSIAWLHITSGATKEDVEHNASAQAFQISFEDYMFKY